MLTSQHRSCYEAALQAYTEARRVAPDREWKAMLLLVTALPSLWRKAEPYLDFRRGEAHLGDVKEQQDLSSGEVDLLHLASNLFNGNELVDVGALANTLDPERWAVVLEALQTYRES